MRVRCRFGASRQEVVVKGRSARPHFPHLLIIAKNFLLGSLLLLGLFLHLGELCLDLTDLGCTRKIVLELFDNPLEDLIIKVVHLMSDVKVGGVRSTSTETILAVVPAGLFQDRTEVLEFTRAEFEVCLQSLDNVGSDPRNLLGLAEGQSPGHQRVHTELTISSSA
jgi:hypothetical protein